MYHLAHFLRDKFPFVWDMVNWLNSLLFSARYGRRMKLIRGILNAHFHDQDSKGLGFVKISDCQAYDLERFFASQPEEAYKFFRPHGFDVKSLKKLQRNKAFLGYIVKNGNTLVGYFFLRSFFFGKAYLGKMVDHDHQGKGIGKMMCLCAMDIASALGLRMFETISKDNLSSLYSTQNVLETRIVEEMPDNYLMIEDLRRKE